MPVRFWLLVCVGFLWWVPTVFGQADVMDSDETDGMDSDEVTIRFVVTVPLDTPKEATVYLSGDAPELGNWDAAGLELDRGEGGDYIKDVVLVRDKWVEFKVTLGSWVGVEKSDAGEDIENRDFVADVDKEVHVIVASWAGGEPDRPAPSLTGDIQKHKRFHSEILGNARTLVVYLPPGYDDEPGRRFPVLYMHDGQNIFDASTSFAGVEWQVDEAAERLIKAGKIEPIIIVGMYNNSDRMTEYTPRTSPRITPRITPRAEGEQGDAYSRFVVEEVKPFIDRTYRTDPAREKTGVAGSSLGGLISLHMAREHAQTFGLCGGVSPSLGWGERELLTQWEAGDNDWMKQTRFWIDMGTKEGRAASGGSVTTAVLNARALAEVFDRAGLVRGEDYQYLEIEGGRHNESAWSDRIESVLMFLYGR